MAFIFPVIGKTEWSPGSWMPGTLTHRGRTHAAIDIYAKKGSPIVTPVTGTVVGRGSGNIGGNWIQIRGDDGRVYYFAHMIAPTKLAKGTHVSGGQVIGAVGNTGSAKHTEPHLHFSVKKNGKAVNPAPMLKQAVVVPDVTLKGKAGGSSAAPWTQPWPDGEGPPGADEWLPLEAQTEVPAWYQQLADARANPQLGPEGNPLKMRAANALQNSLHGMASMVRRYGFQTDDGGGMDGSMNQVTRSDEDEGAADGVG